MARQTGARRRGNARKARWRDAGVDYLAVIWTKLDGRRGSIRCGLWGDRDANDRADELIAKLNHDPSYDVTTLGHYAASLAAGWAENVGDGPMQMPPSTYSNYSRTVANKLLGTPLAQLILGNVRQSDIGRWVLSLRKKDGKTPLSRATIHGHIGVVSKILTQAKRDGLALHNAAHGFMRTLPPGPRRGHGVSKAMTTRQLAEFLAIAENDPDCALLSAYATFASQLGLRIGEGFGAAWTDIDPENRRIRICRQMAATKVGFPSRTAPLKQSKAWPARWVALSGSLIDWLATHRVQQQERALRSYTVASTFIMGVEPKQYSTALIHLAEQFDIVCSQMKDRPNITVRSHTFRHTRAVGHLRQGGDIKALQLLLGHARLNTTDQFYGDLAPEEDPAGAAAWDANMEREREILARLRGRGTGTK